MTGHKEPFILLVEDSEDDAFFFKRSLQKSGASCAVCHLTNGLDAIDYLKNVTIQGQQLPKAIFLDLKMPIVNGFEVLEWLKDQTFSKELQVYVLSGSDHLEDQKRAKALGATRYIVKPVHSEELRTFLQLVCKDVFPERSTGL